MPSSLPLDLLEGQDAPAAQAWLAAHPDVRLSVDTLLKAAQQPSTDMLAALWPHCTNRVRHAAARRCVNKGHIQERDRLLEWGGPTLHKALAEWGAREGRLDLLHLADEGIRLAQCFTQAVDRRRWAYVHALIGRVDVRSAFESLTVASQDHVFNCLISAPGLAPLVQQLLDVARPATWADACRACTGKSRPNPDTIRCFMTHPLAPPESLAGAMMGLARQEPDFMALLHEMGQKLAHTSLWDHVPAVRMIPEEARLARLDRVGAVAPARVRRAWLAQWGEHMPWSQQVEQAGLRHIEGAKRAPRVHRSRIRT